ncbi:MAG: acyltransferase [Phycisphaeraceae bacterium]|nr:acyltransferase [Phycisphaeraceae bacterium]
MPSAAVPVSRDHLPVLDGLRGFAALLVLWGHLRLQTAIPALQASGFGVQVFFVLSGFLITRILLYNKQNHLGLGRFYKRRVLRIFPPFYLMLLLFWLCFRNHEGLLYAATYTYNFSGVSNFPIDHTWTLCVEEHYYLLWPLIVALLPMAWSWRAAVLLALLSVASYIAVNVHLVVNTGKWVPANLATWTPFQIVGLLAGSALAYHQHRIVGRRYGQVLGITLMISSIVLCETIIFFGHCFSIGMETPADTLRGNLFAAGLLAFLLSRKTPELTALFEMKWLRGVGRISYGLYLYHMPIFMLFDLWRPRPGLSTLFSFLAVSLTFLAAAASYRWFERPILDGRLPWARSIRANQPAPKAPPSSMPSDGL